MSEVMTFGDSFNDSEVLSTVGFGVTMDNDEEATEAAVQFVCPNVDEGGVLCGLQGLDVV